MLTLQELPICSTAGYSAKVLTKITFQPYVCICILSQAGICQHTPEHDQPQRIDKIDTLMHPFKWACLSIINRNKLGVMSAAVVAETDLIESHPFLPGGHSRDWQSVLHWLLHQSCQSCNKLPNYHLSSWGTQDSDSEVVTLKWCTETLQISGRRLVGEEGDCWKISFNFRV